LVTFFSVQFLFICYLKILVFVKRMVIIFVLVLVSLTKIARLRTCTYFFGSAASQCFWAPPLVCLSVGIVSTKTNMWQCRFDCPMGHGTDLPPHKTLPCCIVITVDKINACVLLCVFRYWFCKDIDKHWLPVGCNFRRFVNDIKRVWPGPGLNGLQLWQIGVSLPIEDLTEPYVPVSPADETSMCTDNMRLFDNYSYLFTPRAVS